MTTGAWKWQSMQASAFSEPREPEHEITLGLIVYGRWERCGLPQNQIQLLLLHRAGIKFPEVSLRTAFQNPLGFLLICLIVLSCSVSKKSFRPAWKREYTVDPAGFRALCAKTGAFPRNERSFRHWRRIARFPLLEFPAHTLPFRRGEFTTLSTVFDCITVLFLRNPLL